MVNSESRSREKNVITNLSHRGFLAPHARRCSSHRPGARRHRHHVPSTATHAQFLLQLSKAARPPRSCSGAGQVPAPAPPTKVTSRRARPPRPRPPPSAKKPTLLAEARTCSGPVPIYGRRICSFTRAPSSAARQPVLLFRLARVGFNYFLSNSNNFNLISMKMTFFPCSFQFRFLKIYKNLVGSQI